MFPFAVEAGIDAREYWLYTITEINTTIKAYKQRLATRASFDYRMVDLIAASVARIMAKNAKFPSFDEAYPGLIDPERSAQLEHERKVARQTAYLLNFAAAHNAKLARGEEKNG